MARSFARERNNTHVTELGKRVEPHLRRVAEAVTVARAEAGAFAKLAAPVLRLGVDRTVSLSVMIDLIERYAQSHPTAEIIVLGGSSGDLLESLRSGDLELVVVAHERGEPDDLHYHRLAEDRPIVVMPASHRQPRSPKYCSPSWRRKRSSAWRAAPIGRQCRLGSRPKACRSGRVCSSVGRYGCCRP